MKADLQQLPLSKLTPHPDNPRIGFRDDVVNGITTQLKELGAFSDMHALIVRPLGDSFQILSGHQRREAAERAELKTVPCWVTPLSDADAFMLLVTCNAQGELFPLEIGIHALKAVPKSEGGRGKKGGLSEYASKLGKTQQYVSQLRDAAEVISAVKLTTQVVGFLDKAKHLSAIHKLPRPCWQAACEWLAGSDAPVADVEKRVGQATEYAKQSEIPKDWADYLPTYQCVAAIFTGTDPNNFRKLLDVAQRVHAGFVKHDSRDSHNGRCCSRGKLADHWRTWLLANIRGDSWDIKKVQDKRVELEDISWECENSEIEQETVSVVLADPPWQYDFAETDNRQIENQYPTATLDEICSHIKAPWAPPLADDCVLFLWATSPKLREALQVMESWGFEYKTHAVWDKEKIGMGYWFRGQHELLLVGTRGNMSPPAADTRVSSVFREERSKHSKKPECVYLAIEAMFPDAIRCEFYQRKPRNGWKGVGNESAN